MAPKRPRPRPSQHPSLVLKSHRSPHPFFTPTHLSFTDPQTGAKAASWSSRRARKARYAPRGAKVHYRHHHGAGASRAGKAEEGALGKMDSRTEGPAQRGRGGKAEKQGDRVEEMAFTRMKLVERRLHPHLKLDVTFWIAVLFTFGSAVWVVNGYLVWFPILRPQLDTNNYTYTASATAFIGGTIFEIGSYLMVVEALDRGREINFGTALGQLLHHRRHTPRHITLSPSEISASRSRSRSVSQPPPTQTGSSRSSSPTVRDPPSRCQPMQLAKNNNPSTEGKGGGGHDLVQMPAGAEGFVWWGKPMWHDMGYLAAIIQLCAATIFWVSTITGLPGVIPGFADGEGSTAIIDVFFWTPQVLGGTGFIISALILMVEVQTRWWLPNLKDIGWWIGFWNLIGAIGFTLCGALGYSSASGPVYESALSTFWGSWAFLIGSTVQCWEAVYREPAGEGKDGEEDGDGEGGRGEGCWGKDAAGGTWCLG
ncbi:hypothetical protein IAT38_004947 [Cryptococcus sp. DSM 104549]